MTKILIASDLHGSAYFTSLLTDRIAEERPDRILLLGDLLYHGPRNDLPRDYAPKEVIAMLNSLKNEVLAIRGNCDTEVDQMVLSFPILADYAYLAIDGITVFATHGHVYNLAHLPPLGKRDILLHGHTHVPAWENRDGVWYLYPGSVSIPKADSPHGYMTLEKGTFLWKTLDGSVYHTFCPAAE